MQNKIAARRNLILFVVVSSGNSPSQPKTIVPIIMPDTNAKMDWKIKKLHV